MNLNRRKFLTCTCLASVALLGGKHVCAGSSDLPKYCSLHGGLSDNGITLLKTSGNSDLDRSFNLELTHLAESFDLLPGFGFFDDGIHLNAYAMPDTFIPNTQGTLVFGKNLLAKELAAHEWGGLAVAGIMAHEFGHIYQFQSGLYRPLNQDQATHKFSELHADYLAGYYLGLKRLRGTDFDIKAFLDSLYTKGDMDFNSRTHHGTPLERKNAMLAGYKLGLTNTATIDEAAQSGFDFVKSI